MNFPINLNVKLLIADNDFTIAGYPTEYMPGYDVVKGGIQSNQYFSFC